MLWELFSIVSLLARISTSDDHCSNFQLSASTSPLTGQYLDNHVFITVYEPTVHFCARRCKRQRKCLSFNFEYTSGACSLNNADHITNPASMELSTDNVQYFPVYLWTEVILGSCAHHTCAEDLVCTATSNGSLPFSCKVDDSTNIITTTTPSCAWITGCTNCVPQIAPRSYRILYPLDLKQSHRPSSIVTVDTNDPPINVTYSPVGCFYSGGPNSGFDSYTNLRPEIDWTNLDLTIQKCAGIASVGNVSYFGIEFYGECWIKNETILGEYSLVSASSCLSNCNWGVGAANKIFFYQLHN